LRRYFRSGMGCLFQSAARSSYGKEHLMHRKKANKATALDAAMTASVGYFTSLSPRERVASLGHIARMEDILRRVFAPRRNSCCGRRYSADDDANWAETLDWQTNDYDLYRLFRCLFDRLDLNYQEWGLRLDQLADWEELTAVAMRAASWYRQAAPEYRTYRIYVYLYNELDRLVSKRARRVFNARHQHAEHVA